MSKVQWLFFLTFILGIIHLTTLGAANFVSCNATHEIPLNQIGLDLVVIEPQSVNNGAFNMILNNHRLKRLIKFREIVSDKFSVKSSRIRMAHARNDENCCTVFEDTKEALVHFAKEKVSFGNYVETILNGATVAINQFVLPRQQENTAAKLKAVLILAEEVKVAYGSYGMHKWTYDKTKPCGTFYPTYEQLKEKFMVDGVHLLLATPNEHIVSQWDTVFDPKDRFFLQESTLLETLYPICRGDRHSPDVTIAEFVQKKTQELACDNFPNLLRKKHKGKTTTKPSAAKAIFWDVAAAIAPTRKNRIAAKLTMKPPVSKSLESKVCREKTLDRKGLKQINLHVLWIEPESLKDKESASFLRTKRTERMNALQAALDKKVFKKFTLQIVTVKDDMIKDPKWLRTFQDVESFAQQKPHHGESVKSMFSAVTALGHSFEMWPSRRTLRVIAMFAESIKNPQTPGVSSADIVEYPSLPEVKKRLEEQHVDLLLITPKKQLRKYWKTVFKRSNAMFLPLSSPADLVCRNQHLSIHRFIRKRIARIVWERFPELQKCQKNAGKTSGGTVQLTDPKKRITVSDSLTSIESGRFLSKREIAVPQEAPLSKQAPGLTPVETGADAFTSTETTTLSRVTSTNIPESTNDYTEGGVQS